ncbi:DUF1801 domain-containing protein [Flavobacterium sp. J27]|uniref:DUF1801 domain-containing protein n=1 Tax=Flavobacterium sp. J27 TaxID=2060419 RepID=UPI001030EE40|nr:DUF1801 domain-containing protein [Flavobacterium sp. J27]
MSKNKETKAIHTDNQKVSQHIQQLNTETAVIVENIRQFILQAHPEIQERIKWNHPSFYFAGKMEDFDPKEYKRDIAVFNLFKNKIILVFPNGAEIEDPSNILEGQYKDGRRLLYFSDLQDTQIKKDALQNCIKNAIDNIKNK